MESVNGGRPFTTSQSAAWSWNRRAVAAAVRTGRIRTITRGVHVDATVPDSRQLRLAALRLVAPEHAVACNETAAWLYGIDAFKPSEQHLLEPSFVVEHGTSRIRRAEVRCRQGHMPVHDVTRLDGLWVTTPLRTALDLLRSLYRPFALASVDAMVGAGLVDRHHVSRAALDLKGFPGIVQARELASVLDSGAESPGESWMRLRLLDAGLPRPVTQFEVVDDFGRTRRLDAAYPESMVGVEYDGRRHHSDEADRAHDRARRGYLSDVLGWRLVVATHSTIFGPDAAFESEVATLLGRTARLPRQWGTWETKPTSTVEDTTP